MTTLPVVPQSRTGLSGLARRLVHSSFLYDLRLAWRNVSSRPVQSFVTVLVVGAAIGLTIAVLALSDGLRRGIVQASDPFGVLVVGPKGSAQQLVLSTLLLQGVPVGNMDAHIWEGLAVDPRVAFAIPLAMGDNVGGARILGTTTDFFDLRPSLDEPPAFQLAQGRLFADDFEAVLGNRAARQLGLTLGDSFLPQHGVERGLASDDHAIPHTVVGILRPVRGPYDNAVFTTLASVHAAHAEESEDGAMDEEHAEEGHGGEEQITAIFVRPRGFIEANEIWQEFYAGNEAQAVFPGRELGALFDLLDQGRRLLALVGYLAGGMALLTLFLAIYSGVLAREQMLAVMRSLGASRTRIFRLVLWEALLLAQCGAVVGRLLGYGAALVIARQIDSQAAIPTPVRFLPELELWLLLLPLLFGLLAGLLPAWQAYRTDVVQKLFPA